MLVTVLSLLGQDSKLQPSFRPGRRGWVVTSRLPPRQLQSRLRPWVDRIVPIHSDSGRYFLQPNNRYFARSLPAEPPGFWKAEAFTDSAQRRERLRRLAPFLVERPSLLADPRGAILLKQIVLRIDNLSHPDCLQQKWLETAKDFDKLWMRVPLMSLSLTPVQVRILRLLVAIASPG